MRLFFALWPPPAAQQALGAWARAVQRETGGRATRDETIHLTLAFLGESDPAKAGAAAASFSAKRFSLGMEISKYWKHNQIVWVGPEASPPELTDLVSRLHGALGEEGFVLEKRPFAAHVTLIRKAAAPKALPPLPPVTWPADEFVLVRSVPTGKGSRYEIHQRFPLT